MKIIAGVASAALVAWLGGCISLKVGTETPPSCLKIEGLADGYVTLSALHDYNGTILEFGLLNESLRKGEILSLDVWPLAGVGVGVVGARVRVLPLEAGLGVLWYNPKPQAASQEKPRKVEGSGHIAKEERPVSDFNRVSLRGGAELNVTQGDRESLSIEADDNILPLIETEVTQGTLSIGPKERQELRPSRPCKINLAVKELEGITLSGAVTLKASGLTAEKLDVTTSGWGKIAMDALVADALTVCMSGSGDCTLSGLADAQTIQVSGSGEYHAGKLEGKSVKLTISGSGSAVVWAMETLDVNIMGSGRVEYYGQPRVTQDVSGSGRVISLGPPK
jgi:hypothetical protein